MKMMEGIGSDLSIYQCPNCGCTDRDRHLWLFMGAAGILRALPHARVLHVAPERHIEQLIQQRQPQEYVRGDLFPRDPRHVKLNLESLEMPDNSFDIIICNHVLEHVHDLPKSLSELHRCLKPGGVLIAQTPFSPILKYTMECTIEITPEFAEYFFGQKDHVRLFGTDIVEWFHRAGFQGEPIDHKIILSELDAMSVGCNHREPFFAFTK
ncbi:MAG: class I SAM-dependent methyltransferase [Aquabacterium sp.]|jgi:SAM-dependent methyltransferase|nr:class I SAM-dependent methyltransferase [Aquabacterium sp.]MBP9063413.1 class I SAM-dependent methyltransferase [Aquabacterium sp.]